MMTSRCARRVGLAVGLVAATAASVVWAEARNGVAQKARLQSSTGLTNSRTQVLAQEDSLLFCFEGTLSALVNPGCFVIPSTQPGDCSSRSTHFFIQYVFPDVVVPHRVRGFGFLSNDDDTVFPSAGILQIDIDQGAVRFPTATELANLPVTNIDTPGDTSVVFVDLDSENMVINPGDNKALVIALQFPPSGTLTAETVGPGIAADTDVPDQDCDFFTVDAGVSGAWFAPCFNDPVQCPNATEPLDWGFAIEVEPVTAVEDITWSRVKTLYRTP